MDVKHVGSALWSKDLKCADDFRNWVASRKKIEKQKNEKQLKAAEEKREKTRHIREQKKHVEERYEKTVSQHSTVLDKMEERLDQRAKSIEVLEEVVEVLQKKKRMYDELDKKLEAQEAELKELFSAVGFLIEQNRRIKDFREEPW